MFIQPSALLDRSLTNSDIRYAHPLRKREREREREREKDIRKSPIKIEERGLLRERQPERRQQREKERVSIVLSIVDADNVRGGGRGKGVRARFRRKLMDLAQDELRQKGGNRHGNIFCVVCLVRYVHYVGGKREEIQNSICSRSYFHFRFVCQHPDHLRPLPRPPPLPPVHTVSHKHLRGGPGHEPLRIGPVGGKRAIGTSHISVPLVQAILSIASHANR
jgi:hypothetical protein